MENLIDCSVYINDARLLQLTLLGGGTGLDVEGYDWEFILNHLSLIQYDGYISRGILFGELAMHAGIAWAAFGLLLQRKQG